MATEYYIVKKNDTLSGIAEMFKSKIKKSNGQTISDNTTRTNYLATINGIKNKNLIYPGQKIYFTSKTDGEKPNTGSKVIVTEFGVQSGTNVTLYAAWRWTKSYTENYEYQWEYDTGDGIWFVGERSTTTYKYSTYSSVPDNAKRVRFRVKPIAKKRTVNKKEVAYWTAEWTSWLTHYKSNDPPQAPSSPPTITYDPTKDKYKLTVSCENLKPAELNANYIQFAIQANHKGLMYTSSPILIRNGYASHIFKVDAGSDYSAKCRTSKSTNAKENSEWTDWSSLTTIVPSTPKEILELKAYSSNQFYVRWSEVKNAKYYEIQYTTKKDYFDKVQNEVSSETTQNLTNPTQTNIVVTPNDQGGSEYFVRVRAVNDNGSSGWTSIKSCVLGKKPAPPTTWSSTITAISGEIVKLYWVHNSSDGSSWTSAKLTMRINGVSQTPITITNSNINDEDKRDEPGVYSIDTGQWADGVKIEWEVITAGVLKNEYSDPSITRTLDVYAPPTLSLSMTNSNGESIDTVTSFPFYISGSTGPATQTPIGYSLTITSNEVYETVDEIGNTNTINVGESVYSKLFDTNRQMLIEISSGNIDLENGVSYTASCTVTMNSGLTADASFIFTVSWEDIEYSPNAEIIIDEEALTASIRPYCEDEYGELIEGVLMSVYRREFDGTFTEISNDIDNTKNTFVTDPHPSLDYARYRVVAKDVSTGAISFYDVPGYPIAEKSIVIQWDDEWRPFDVTEDAEDEELVDKTWNGSMLKLPYNIDVSDKYSPDVSLVNYIGRRNPVSYYGTQIGSTSSWSTDIPKEDAETLYALRRLAVWMGDVYVREPSGSGYWANINVSFNQTHSEVIIPVSIEVKRVEGGI